MDLGDTVTAGLGAWKSLDDAAAAFLPDAALAILLLKKTEDILEEAADLENADASVAKQAYSALATVFLEAARNNFDASVLQGVFDDAGIKKARSTAACERYGAMKSQLRAVLASQTSHFPRVVDVEWRLDYVIKSKNMEKLNYPLYIVTLVTELPVARCRKDVQFTCTLEQLQHLVDKLKDASRQAQRHVEGEV